VGGVDAAERKGVNWRVKRCEGLEKRERVFLVGAEAERPSRKKRGGFLFRREGKESRVRRT